MFSRASNIRRGTPPYSRPSCPSWTKRRTSLTKLRDLYSKPSPVILRQPPPSPTEVSRFKVRRPCSETEYSRELDRLDAAGMLCWSQTPPICVNGFFSVKKDENSERFIIDARPSNLFWTEPGYHVLASPSHFCDMLLAESRALEFSCKQHRCRLLSSKDLPHYPAMIVGTFWP